MTLNKRVGGVGLIVAVEQTFAELASDWWELYAEPSLSPRTLELSGLLLDNYLLPRIGGLRLREITAETVAGLRVDLERATIRTRLRPGPDGQPRYGKPRPIGRLSVAWALGLVDQILQRGVA